MRARSIPALLATGLLAGCGSAQQSTVTVQVHSPAQRAAAPTATTTTQSQATTPSTTTSTTRTESEPEFVEHHTEGLAGAAATVRTFGYTPVDESQYHPDQTLRVLVGARNGEGGYDQLAFFFIGNRYIGTDVKLPSAKISIAAQSESAVTIVYPLYRPGDKECCATGGSARVTFALENGRLIAMQTIPALSQRNPGYRP
ncbi:MAG TPA: LppP/LprE family lipoprotein [Solirubrobacteraceae bacterium]|nr:LppP/LprE family lipoprotein [Solirubrobacteraceae bacterium]